MRKLIVVLTVLLAPTLVMACDICGCGVGNNYIGILPDFSKHIFGLRYRYNSLLTHRGVGGATTYLTTNEKYNTAELWGGWTIGGKFRVMASLPYSFNSQENQGNKRAKNGIGDISFSGYYQLINSRKTVFDSKLLVQSLWVGGGVKLPTGKYNPADKSTTVQSANLFQLGTASTDFFVGAMYDIRLQDVGINMTANYKMNTTNKYEYEYGNKVSLNAQAYYKIKVAKAVTVAPNAGVQFENATTDLDNKFDVSVSGGNLLLGTAGVETAFSKFAIGANFQTPLSQNLANGFVKANNRMMIHLSVML